MLSLAVGYNAKLNCRSYEFLSPYYSYGVFISTSSHSSHRGQKLLERSKVILPTTLIQLTIHLMHAS